MTNHPISRTEVKNDTVQDDFAEVLEDLNETPDNLDTDKAFLDILGEVVVAHPSEQVTAKFSEIASGLNDFLQRANPLPTGVRKFEDYVYLSTEERYYKKSNPAVSMKQGGFNAELYNDIPTDENGRKVEGSAHWYFIKTVGQTADTLSYAPSKPKLFVEFGKRCLNTFTEPTYPKLESHEGNVAVEAVKKHLERYYPESHEDIIKWWAHNVQKPGDKILWALAFIGIEGSGKSLSEKVLRTVMTDTLVKNVSSRVINSDFTDWSWGSCVCAIDELSMEKKSTMDTFKDVISNGQLSINRKGHSVIEGVRNTQNYIITSNHADALPVSATDRRWLISDDRIASLYDVKQEHGEDYYHWMSESVLKENAGALRSWLLSIDITGFNTIIAPMTSSKREMFEQTRSYEYHIVKDLIDDNQLDPGMVSSKIIGRLYKEESSQGINPKKLGIVLKELGLRPKQKTVKDKAKLNHTIYYNPNVYDAEDMSNDEIKGIVGIDTGGFLRVD